MQITQLNIASEMIDLGVGQPDPELLPLEVMQQAARHRLDRMQKEPLQYGNEQGSGFFRATLADFLTDGYQVEIDPEHIMITAGATHGLDLICTYFASPGDTIFVEEPTYFLALRIFQDRRLKVIGIPADRQGPVIAELKKKLADIKPAFFYTIPTFHNPSGTTMTNERRQQVLRLGREHGFKIVADEVYHLLSYGRQPPTPMAALDTKAGVIGLGSFSKILAPGLRLGWIQAHPDILQRITGGGLLLSSGGMNPFTSSLVQSAIETGLQSQHLERMKVVYRKRAAHLVDALHRNMPDSVSFENPPGGFFIWLQLGSNTDTSSLRRLAIQKNVNFQPGVNFSASGQLQHCLRLCFVYYNSDRLEEGARRLGNILKADTVSG